MKIVELRVNLLTDTKRRPKVPKAASPKSGKVIILNWVEVVFSKQYFISIAVKKQTNAKTRRTPKLPHPASFTV